MPLELGLALYRSHDAGSRHRVFVFEKKAYRAHRSTSDANGLDPQIHRGTVKGVMAGLRNIFLTPANPVTVPQMLAAYRAVRRKLPDLKRNAGSRSVFTASVFKDLKLAALVSLPIGSEGKRRL